MYELEFFDVKGKRLFRLYREKKLGDILEYAEIVCRSCGIPCSKHNVLITDLEEL